MILKCGEIAREYGCVNCIYRDRHDDVGMGCCLTAMEVAHFHNKKLVPHEASHCMTESDIVFIAPESSFLERCILKVRITIAVNKYLRSNGFPRVYFIKIKGRV